MTLSGFLRAAVLRSGGLLTCGLLSRLSFRFSPMYDAERSVRLDNHLRYTVFQLYLKYPLVRADSAYQLMVQIPNLAHFHSSPASALNDIRQSTLVDVHQGK
jgi:hypothetical protein